MGDYEHEPLEPKPVWWVVSEEMMMGMLYEVHHGATPESVYIEHYVNSNLEQVEGKDDV